MSVPNILSTHALSVGYRMGRGRSRTVLPELDLSLHSGELVCLLGANGTGKSTLLRTLAGLQPPIAGSVRLRGTSLAEISKQQRARDIAVVLTGQVEVGALRGRDLVAMGRAPYTGWAGRLRDSDEHAVDRALGATGAHDIAQRTLDELSDGERQRLMVSRALAQQPSVVLLDEPTAFLDAPRRAELTAVLRRLSRETGIAALLSTHDVELALRNADRVWLVLPDGGTVVGAPEDLAISGALHEAFGGREFAFDALAGGFRVTVPTRGAASVQGTADAVTTAWTARTLRRCGLDVQDEAGNGDGAPELTVRITGEVGVPRWQLTDTEGTSEHATLGSLADHLRG